VPSARTDPDCLCGHPQSHHEKGFGVCRICRSGCIRARLHKGRGGLEILQLLDPGKPPYVPPTFRVQCPECGNLYVTRSYAREIVQRKRCRACSDARRARKKSPTPSASRPGDLPDAERFAHGTRSRYVAGCRCEPCTASNREYARLRQKLGRMGQGNPLVSAARARRHLERLARAGVGRRQIADAAQTAASAIAEIRAGRKTKLRRETEARILAVTEDARADASTVDAASTQKIVALLLDDGFTRSELARRLGSTAKVPALQLGGDRVLARNAAAVARLYREIHGRDAPRRGRPRKTSRAATAGVEVPRASSSPTERRRRGGAEGRTRPPSKSDPAPPPGDGGGGER
jgi:hypothetical protein